MSFDIESVVSDSVKLFSLPQIYTWIKEVVDDPESSLDEVAEVISQDIGLSTRLLKLVNSSFYSFSEKSIPSRMQSPLSEPTNCGI